MNGAYSSKNTRQQLPSHFAAKGGENVSLSGATCSIRVVSSAGVGNTGIVGALLQNCNWNFARSKKKKYFSTLPELD